MTSFLLFLPGTVCQMQAVAIKLHIFQLINENQREFLAGGRERGPSAGEGQLDGRLLLMVATRLGLVSAVSLSPCHLWTPAQASSERGVSACGGAKRWYGLCARQADPRIWTAGRSLGVAARAWASSPHCFHTLLFTYFLRCFLTLVFSPFFPCSLSLMSVVSLLCFLCLQSPLVP